MTDHITGCFTPPTTPGEPTALDASAWAQATWGLGAQWLAQEQAATFAVHAPAASRVLLEVYAAAVGEPAVAEFVLARDPEGVWRGKLGGVRPGLLYAFRCWGPNWPYDTQWSRGGSGAGFCCDVDETGNRFNPNKVLFDPYAREITHNTLDEEIERHGGDGGVFGTGGETHHGRPRRELDTGPFAPKGILVVDDTATGSKPALDAEHAAICESHIRTMTLHPSAGKLSDLLGAHPGFERVRDIPTELRGTYRGMALMAPYLKAVGFTTVELLPVQETSSSDAPDKRAGSNHWGYQTLAYFAPNRSYAADRSHGGPTREFKEMIRAFHDEGLEVYLDVVYNHTAEGGHWNGDNDTIGFVSLGGFAVNDYYVQTDAHHLVDGATGCSNQVNASSAAAQNLVLDSLRYWCETMGVDGFRFDLAPVLGRTPNAFEREHWDQQKQFFPVHPLLASIAALAEEQQIEVIAEAWDMWGYEVGNFPAGWGEWNGRFRDAVRGFLKGDGNTMDFIAMVNGDFECFNDQGGPQKSINFVTAHDGFTMMDLVSYNTKNNDEPYPFGPSDGGADNNLSWDSGGDHALRRTRLRNFWTVLFLSRGVPMVVSGDEFGRTQNGNNNPWSLNTVGIWNNWQMPASNAPTRVPVDPEHPEYAYHDVFGETAGPGNPFFTFTCELARMRQRYPSLRQRSYGNAVLDDDDVSYLFHRPNGRDALEPGDRCVRLHIDGSGVGDPDLLVLINMTTEPVGFDLTAEQDWLRIIDTAAWAEEHANWWAPEEAGTVHGAYDVQPWSIAVLQEETTSQPA